MISCHLRPNVLGLIAAICLLTNFLSAQAAYLIHFNGNYTLYSNQCSELTGIATELNFTSIPTCAESDRPHKGQFMIPANEVSHQIKAAINKPCSDMNCWGTSMKYWEITETPRHVNNKELQVVLESQFVTAISKDDIRAGDLAVLREKSNILHSVIFISQDLAFDKSGLGPNKSFRIGKASDLFTGVYSVESKDRNITYYRLRLPRDVVLSQLNLTQTEKRSEFLAKADELRFAVYQISSVDFETAETLEAAIENEITAINNSALVGDERALMLANFLDIHEALEFRMSRSFITRRIYPWEKVFFAQKTCTDLLDN